MYVKNVALFCGAIIAAVSACAILMAAAEVHYIYFERYDLTDLGPFTRFEFSTVGHIYDASDRPLIELALDRREILRYEDIPPVVRDAILAAEDKRFFSHNGIDYLSLPRVLGKVSSWSRSWASRNPQSGHNRLHQFRVRIKIRPDWSYI